ncbi:MAG: histidinol-phosphate transaminase [Nitrososphaeria archaeon]
MLLKKSIRKRLSKLEKTQYYPLEDTREMIARLNLNENFVIDKEEMIRLANETLREVDFRLYPNTEQDELIRCLSEKYGLSKDCFALGCGEDQLIDMLINVFGRRNKVVSITPTFPVYRYRTLLHGGIFIGVPLNSDFSLNVEKLVKEGKETNLLFICSPNNPTGNQFSKKVIEEVLSSVECLVVVDEAYVDFAEYSVYPMVSNYENLVVLRTFSKAYGLAGLRLGYMITSPRVAKPIATVAQLTYPVVNFALKMATKLIRNDDLVLKAVKQVKEERERLYNELIRMGIDAKRSQANFILFKSPINPKRFYNALVKNKIIIRNSGMFFGDHYFRVTVGTRELNDMFIKVVKRIINK